MSSIKFPSPTTQLLSALVHFLGASILTHCLSRRLASETFPSFKSLLEIPFARTLILMAFLDSWFFIVSSSILSFGVGLGQNLGACYAASYLCSVFYATSKAIIYQFLVEKVYIVWEPINNRSKLKSPLYILCSFSMFGYLTLFILLLSQQMKPLFDSNDICTIGIKVYVTTGVLAFDLYINTLLTTLFVIPLWRGTYKTNPALRGATIRTFIAAIISLTVSTANILMLCLMHGRQPAWFCLFSCNVDIVINALVLFWVTSRSSRSSKAEVCDAAVLPSIKPSELFRHTGQTDTRMITLQDTSCQIFVCTTIESESNIQDGDQGSKNPNHCSIFPSTEEMKRDTSDSLAL